MTLALPAASKTAPHLLLVEDDLEISRALAHSLAECGFEISCAASATAMEAVLQTAKVDLVLLDIMLPGEDGLSICRRIRTNSAIPIIMLTALTEEVERVVGLEVGADDYVGETLQHARADCAHSRASAPLRRRSALLLVPSDVLVFEGWEIDPASRQVRNPNGIQVQMTSAEFDLLLAFCRNPNRVLSREQLLELTHSGLAGPIERSIDVHVSRIRQKIERDPHDPVLIKTVRLGGYILTARVSMK